MNEVREVELPNGVVIPDVPVTATQEEIQKFAIDTGLATYEDFLSEEVPTKARIEAERARQTEKTFMEQAQPYIESGIEGAGMVPPLAALGRGLQYASQGTKAAPYIAELARSVMPKSGKALFGEGALGFMAGATGRMASEALPEDSSQGARTLAGTVGGMVPAVFASPVKNIYSLVSERGMGKQGLSLFNQSADAAGVLRAKKEVDKAFGANPYLPQAFKDARKIEESTGVSLPMLAAAKGDATISSFIQSQIASGDASFSAAMRLQYAEAEKALTIAKGGVAPTMKEVDELVKQRAATVQAKNEQFKIDFDNRVTEANNKLKAIDDKLSESAVPLEQAGREDIGGRLTNLIKAKETTLRKEYSTLYEDVLTTATENGIKLPAENAKRLVSFVNDEMRMDTFAKFPQLYTLVKTKFQAPQAASPRIAAKYRIAKETGEGGKDIDVRTLDSLKRAVNKAISDTNDRDQLRQLMSLKTEVNAAIDGVDPAFSLPYKAIDAQFAKALGLPFSEAGMVQISRAKFVENTVPVITNTASGLKQVMSVVGDSPEGIKLIEDAFISAVAKNRSVVNTNTLEVNPAALNRWMKDNKEQLSLVPNVQKRLEELRDGVRSLKDERSRIMTMVKEDKAQHLEDLLAESFASKGGIEGYLKTLINVPAELDKMLVRISGDKEALDAVKGTLLDLMTKDAQKNSLKWFDNNIPAIAKVFGGDQVPKLRYILEATDRLANNQIKAGIPAKTARITKMQEKTGTSPEQLAGETRAHIISKTRQLFNFTSRFFQNKASKSEAANMQAMLLNPKLMQDYADLVAEVETKGFTDKAIDLGRQIFKQSAATYAAGATVGAITANINEPLEPEPFKVTDPSLLEGFPQ